jgi:lipopolysaccharide transport system ATP-binding protein
MSDTAIVIEHLSKSYVIDHQRESQEGLRHAIERAVRSPLGWLRSRVNRRELAREVFWALRDVSFEVRQGEVLGIIGANGAGKSTLLKVLSRITEPTRGRILTRGRIASLLEVGTGFHPELTGRENIFLNGIILGMTRAEITRKFDAIVGFAGVEKFIDTPTKRYSSGMYVRLAFAVAAHLEPDILIIDEVLAVGDAAFQKQCLGKMDDVAKQGRTVLFVSHNMAMITHLCARGILLRKGSIAADGRTDDVIAAYRADVSGLSAVPLAARTDRAGTGNIILTGIAFLTSEATPVGHVASGECLIVRVHYRCRARRRFTNSKITLVVRCNEQLCVVLSTVMAGHGSLTFEGEGYLDFMLPELPLAAGTYSWDCFIESNDETHDVLQRAAEISVEDGDFFGTGRVRPTPGWKNVGVLVRHSCRAGRGAETLLTSSTAH